MVNAADLTKQGIAAYQAGDRAAAAELFQQATDADPGYEMAWLWRSSVAATDAEKRAYLERALEVNPASEPARRGLAKLGAVVEAPPESTPTSALTPDDAPARPPPKRRRVSAIGVLITAVLAIGLVIGGSFALNGFSFDTSCAHRAKDFLDHVQPIAREWDDANKLADSTPRVGLAVQIGKLQEVRRRAQGLEPPACARPAQESLVASMDATIQGYIDFLGQKGDATVKADFDQASTHMQAFGEAMRKMREP